MVASTLPLDMDSPNMGPNIKRYGQTKVYIIDDIDPSAPSNDLMGVKDETYHEKKVAYIRKFFETHTTAAVHGVVFKQGTTREGFFDYWKEELNKCTEADLLIIYYDGYAGDQEKEYSWKLEGYPKGWIDAYRLIDMVNNGSADAMFLLDCWVHTRISKKWRLPQTLGEDLTMVSTGKALEILARPQRLQDPDGQIRVDKGDFTKAMVRNLDNFVKGIRGKFKNCKTLRSIPQLMARDRIIYSNPTRIWINRTRAGDEDLVNRFLIDPYLVRKTGKIEFFAKTIQGEKDTVDDLSTPENLHHEAVDVEDIVDQAANDEGMDEEGMDDEAVDVEGPDDKGGKGQIGENREDKDKHDGEEDNGPGLFLS